MHILSTYFLPIAVVVACCLSCQTKHDKVVIIDSDEWLQHSLEQDFSLGHISTERSYSGEKSILLHADSRFGLGCTLNNLKAGKYYHVSFYKYGESTNTKLVITNNWNKIYFQSNWYSSEEKGWKKMEARFFVPSNVATPQAKVFLHHLSSDSVWVDQLKIKQLNALDNELPDYIFYPILYDLLDDYNIRFYTHPPNFESLIAHAQHGFDPKIYTYYSSNRHEFLRKVKMARQQLGDKQLFDQLGKWKKKIAFPTVQFKAEAGMEIKKPAGYIKNMFCWPKDSAEVIIKSLEDCKDISLYQLSYPYQFKYIKPLLLPKDSVLKFSCKDLAKGVYKIQLKGDKDSFEIPLFVNNPQTQKAKIAILAPYTTWQAYNSYGGKSLYRNAVDKKDVVTLNKNRPSNTPQFDSTFLGHDIFITQNIFQWYSSNFGADIYPDYYLEQYPEIFTPYQTIVLAQHCEYFSPAMYNNLVQLLESRNFISLGGNQMYWRILWNKDFSAFSCIRDGGYFPNTNIPAGDWRNTTTSEAKIQGVGYSDAGYATYHPYQVHLANHWLYNGTAVKNGDLFGEKGIDNRGISGDELDKIYLDAPSNTVLLAKGTNPDNGGGELVFIDRKKHATLSCGSIACGSGLGVDSTFSKLMHNFLSKYHSN